MAEKAKVRLECDTKAYLCSRVLDKVVDENLMDYESSGSEEEFVIASGDGLLATTPLPSESRVIDNRQYYT